MPNRKPNRVLILYANECGFPVDMHTGKPIIAPDTARQYVDRYCPWASVYELVRGGIRVWESRDDHARWLAQR